MSVTTLPPPQRMYRALLDRDRSFDGVFVVAVRTTGIFCRPVCPARKPRFENVEFFSAPREAIRAGYRPCRRCRPLDGGRPCPPWVRRLMETVDDAPTERITDADLRAMAVDPARARRYFKEHYGMTFHAYQRSRRVGLALRAIRDGVDVTHAGFDHGYESLSGFREAVGNLFGAAPVASAQRVCLLARQLDTPLGPVLAIAADEGLCLLEFIDRRALEKQVETLRRRLQAVVVPGDHEHLQATAAQLGEYFDGVRRDFDVPLVTPGSEFQQRVWSRLREIPYGSTCSYSELAESIGRPDTRRAVGRANGDNRIAILIPCHRVVRADGTLCGYGGGLWRKKRLLELERNG